MATPRNQRKHVLSAGEGLVDAPHEAKKRVPSYKLRKEEAEELHAQVKALEAQLLVLQKRLGSLDATGSALDTSMAEAELQNARLKRAIACQQLALASTQSMMLQCLVRLPNSLCSYMSGLLMFLNIVTTSLSEGEPVRQPNACASAPPTGPRTAPADYPGA